MPLLLIAPEPRNNRNATAMPRPVKPPAGLLRYFAGPVSGVSFPCAAKHIPITRFASVLFSHSGLHIMGRSLSRSTVTGTQQGAAACPVVTESTRTTRLGFSINHKLLFFHGACFGCFVSLRARHVMGSCLKHCFPYYLANRRMREYNLTDVVNPHFGFHHHGRPVYNL